MGQRSSKASSEAVDGEEVRASGEQESHGEPPPQGNGKHELQKRRVSFYETVDASEVLPYLIIGNLASSKNQEFLTRKNVKYILNLTSEADETVEGVEVKTISLEDDDDQELLPHLDTVFEFISKAAKGWLTFSSSQKKEKGEKGENEKTAILVHSYFGMSRSSAIIIAYLMKEKGWNLKDSYQHLRKKHSSANPNDNFVVQLIRYEQELFDGKISMTVKDFHQ